MARLLATALCTLILYSVSTNAQRIIDCTKDQRLPCVSITAETYFDLGYTVATHFKDRILAHINHDPFTVKMHQFARTIDGAAALKRWQNATKTFDNVVLELEGMAAGLGLSYDDLFLYHCSSEIGILLQDKASMAASASCSDILVDRPRVTRDADSIALDGHNEDGAPGCYNSSYIIQGAVVIRSIPEVVKENFTAFAYAGILPGKAYSFNSHGLTVACNAMFGKKLTTSDRALPRSIMARVMMSEDTLSNLLFNVQTHATGSYITKPVYQSAASFSANIGHTHWGQLVNVEFSSEGVSVQRVEGGFLHHFNMFEHTSGAEEFEDVSSVHRLETLLGRVGPSDRNSTMRFLSDQSDPAYPIFRQGNTPDVGWTISTVVFDLIQRRADIYTTRPMPGTKPTHSYELPFNG